MTPPGDGEAIRSESIPLAEVRKELPMEETKIKTPDVTQNWWVQLFLKVGLPSALLMYFVFSLNDKMERMINLQERTCTLVELLLRK